FLIREFRQEHDHSLDWTSVFLGEPVVTPALLRSLGQIAGAHIWNYQEDVVHARAPFLTVHCTGSGTRAVALPRDWEVYSLNSGQWQNTEAGSLRFHGLDGSTHNFLVGLRHEIETILNADPVSLLFMEHLPTKPDNTLSGDAAAFDVPIMKLGEWMEGAEGDDIADDFLFKAALVEDSEPESEDSRPGRRRRRRGRGSRDREGTEETASRRTDGESVVVEDLGLSVMFRKRE
ncbi:MAG TPA: hypothetical protein VEX38_03185, partial [Fimbriimonadaceae bacterium]|nr:hypothetical protein [Fimbriimonadaceae bacterium]